jgi:hypothetical protein
MDVIPSFEHAKRRIYMTATLANDAVLMTDFGADALAVSRPITPRTASDLGERMILVPQQINPGLTDEDVKAFVVSMASEHNVVVVVPSHRRAQFWADVATPGLTLTADNLRSGVDHLRASAGNLAVMVNKYDGVDLPDDACRVLVVDGLPDARGLMERYDQGTLKNSDRYIARQVQRIEQGMGRGIRSNDDFCAVLLMGSGLLRALFATGASRHFSPATAAQLALSKTVAAQIAKKGLPAMAEAIGDLLARDPGWTAAARNILIDITYPDEVPVDFLAVAQRDAFDAARRGRFELAEKRLRDAVNATSDRRVQGWLLDQVAAAVHPQDRVRSQQILAAANDRNSLVSKPIEGIAYKHVDTFGMDQARQAAAFLRDTYGGDANALLLGLKGLLDDLVFVEEEAEAFEQALADLGHHIGFRAQRPEKEEAAHLDVLWGIGQGEYVLLPCKSGAVSPTISKRYSDEVSGSVNWFSTYYDHTFTAVPVIVHPSDILDSGASPPVGMRVMTGIQVGALRDAVRAFALAVKDRLDEPVHVRQSLSAQGLLGKQVVDRYTVSPRSMAKPKPVARTSPKA